MMIPVAGAASAGDDPELRSYIEATAKMSKSAKPTVGTLLVGSRHVLFHRSEVRNSGRLPT